MLLCIRAGASHDFAHANFGKCEPSRFIHVATDKNDARVLLRAVRVTHHDEKHSIRIVVEENLRIVAQFCSKHFFTVFLITNGPRDPTRTKKSGSAPKSRTKSVYGPQVIIISEHLGRQTLVHC